MGPEALGGYMAGVTVSGVMWAIFQSNAGGAWDNAKKSFEKGVEINGQMFYKGSDPHKAAVTGDTVGDPFKDTSGPSMNILIKLTCLVGLAIAPILGSHGLSGSSSKDNIHMEIRENRYPAGMNPTPTTEHSSEMMRPEDQQQQPIQGANAGQGGQTLIAPGGQSNGIMTQEQKEMEKMKFKQQGGTPSGSLKKPN